MAQLTVVEPKLTIDKKVSVDGGAFVDGPAEAQAGSALTYELLIKNTGTSPAYDVQVADKPDSELTNVVLAAQAGVTVTDGWTALDPQVAWTIDGPIAPGATVTLTYTAGFVAAGLLNDGQSVDNTGSIPHYFGVPKATRMANPTFVYRDYTDGGSDSVKVILDFPSFTTVKTTGAGARTRATRRSGSRSRGGSSRPTPPRWHRHRPSTSPIRCRPTGPTTPARRSSAASRRNR